MDPAVYMQSCAAADLDASTGVCAHPVWLPQPSLFPELDAAASISISVAIWALWATAYGFRKLRRVAD